MAGQIKNALDTIIERRSKGNSTVAFSTKTKLIIKGLNPDKFTFASPDDPAILAKVRAVAMDLGVFL